MKMHASPDLAEDLPRILLLYPQVTSVWERFKVGDNLQRPSLGMQYLMAILQQAGYEFHFIDQAVQNKSNEDLLAEIVGIHSNAMTRFSVCRLIDRIKRETPAKVIVGGAGYACPRAICRSRSGCCADRGGGKPSD